MNSELKAIRSQLNPHFLFNSLNSLQNFINQSDKQAANRHLSRFAQLMRKVIEMSEKESTSLQEEIDFNKTFIELEQLRYGFKCNFTVDEDIDLFNTEIPSMIIQPFIENAVVHCMADLGTKGLLEVSVTEAGPREIMVEIRDNGKGFQAGASQGFGLKSSRERIDIYNAQHRNKIKWVIEKNEHYPDQQGSVVRLIIPKKY
jgi:LytS/YehU family sensor histidine kinase